MQCLQETKLNCFFGLAAAWVSPGRSAHQVSKGNIYIGLKVSKAKGLKMLPDFCSVLQMKKRASGILSFWEAWNSLGYTP